MTSIPLSETSTATNPSTHSSTSRRIISTPQPPTNLPAEGKLTNAFKSSVVNKRWMFAVFTNMVFSVKSCISNVGQITAQGRAGVLTSHELIVVVVAW